MSPGFRPAPQGLLLAFLAREHVLLAGPVGSAKRLGAPKESPGDSWSLSDGEP